jgi:hypothetical protein
MTDADGAAGARPRIDVALSRRRYRHLDRACKLAGVGLVALGLDAGGATPTGLALGAVGTAVALATVFVRRRDSE